jgi:hypothetical protein
MLVLYNIKAAYYSTPLSLKIYRATARVCGGGGGGVTSTMIIPSSLQP